MRYTDSLEWRAFRFDVDENGFIEPSEIHENPDIKIVFFVGSTTETLYVDPEKRFPYLVGRQLESHLGLRVNAYNGGVSGAHTMHLNLILMAKIVPMEPDIVVLMEAANDLGTMLHLGDYWNRHRQRSIIVTEEKTEPERREALTPLRAFKTFLYATFPNTYTTLKLAKDLFLKTVSSAPTDETAPLAGTGATEPVHERRGGKLAKEAEAGALDEFAATRGQKLELDEFRAKRSFRRSLRTFVNVTRLWGAEPVLMTQANRLIENADPVIRKKFEYVRKSNDISYETVRRQHNLFNEIIREVTAAEGIALIDLGKMIPPSSRYMYDSMHFNNRGSELAARVITESLIPVIKKLD